MGLPTGTVTFLFTDVHERELGFRMLLSERQRYERWMSVAQDRQRGEFGAAYPAGAHLTLEEAVAEALAQVPAARQRSARSAP